jgi:anti-anti-sigma factor
MQLMSTLWQKNETTQIFPTLQMDPQLEAHANAEFQSRFQIKESKLTLSVQTRSHGDIVIIQLHGRIVYRDEAATFSHLVRETLAEGARVVLDLSGVTLIDGAGMGELAALHARAQSKHSDLKCAQLQPLVRRHLDLTRLTTFLEIHPSLDEAFTAFDAQYTEVFAGR